MFDKETILKFWNKARPYGNLDPAQYRIDECGALMRFDDYGNRDSDYGWEIDHIVPVSRGGTNELSNLRALQWDNNATRGDGKLIRKIYFNGERNETRPFWNILFE